MPPRTKASQALDLLQLNTPKKHNRKGGKWFKDQTATQSEPWSQSFKPKDSGKDATIAAMTASSCNGGKRKPQ
ncbi:hypothetical protein Lal_00021525 [Lupinus albus]|nr:hypothetical protein Lal_00021525 [Lupinus albus]